MKKQIRKSTFETNSSSTHSFVLDEGALNYQYDIPSPDPDGVLRISGFYDFGWGIERYSDSYTKLAYYIVDHLRPHTTSYNEDLNQSLFEKVLSKESDFAKVIEEVKELTGAKSIEVNIDGDSYVDHQSIGTSKLIESKFNQSWGPAIGIKSNRIFEETKIAEQVCDLKGNIETEININELEKAFSAKDYLFNPGIYLLISNDNDGPEL